MNKALIVTLLELAGTVAAAGGALHPVDLRCEYLSNPLGIDVTQPRLSWRVEAGPGDSTRNRKQSAYQIAVASSKEGLRGGAADVWDSGKVGSSRSIQIAYAGKALSSGKRCFWRVRVWDEKGAASAWSEPAWWSMGLLHPADWQAKWIGLDSGDETSPATPEYTRLPARLLRREFQAKGGIRRATAYVSGLGLFDFYVNGRRAGNHIMDPALTNYTKRVFYVTFDVTEQVNPGANVVGLVLGNGRFFAPRSKSPIGTRGFGYPKALFQLEIEYADGSVDRVVSDSSWKITADGPIRANNEYDGEEYDARKEMPGWDSPGFDDARWQAAQAVGAPGGVMEAQMIEPTRVTQTIRPVSVTAGKSGAWVVDLGQNIYGQIRLRAAAPAGTRVVLRSAYSLHADGSLRTEDNRTAKASDIYIFKGGGMETWSPRFRGQGFRRFEVTGFPGRLTRDNFEGLVVENDVAPAGSFTCSNELLNRIYRNMRWGQRIFQRQGVPLDPDRDERQGWQGDQAKDVESDAFNFQVAPFYAKWLRDIALDQKPDGLLPDVSPAFWSVDTGDIIWPSVMTIVPELLYSMYGDRRVMEQNFETAKRWMGFCSRQMGPDGTAVKPSPYGDWCDAASMDGRGPDNGATDRSMLATAYHYNNLRIMERTSRVLGQGRDAAVYAEEASRVKSGFLKRFFRPATNDFTGGTQTSYIVPLAFGLVPEENRAAVIGNLVDDILRKHGGHFTVGLVGMQWLMQTLTDAGHPEVAFTVATQTTRPSFGYMIGKGATTIWERWDMDTRDPGMNSEALLIQAGAFTAWLYESLAGIRWDPEKPGFEHIILRPHVTGDLTFARARHDSAFGAIASEWKVTGKTLTWDVTIPPNTTATVFVPARVSAGISESGKPASEAAAVRFVRMDQGYAVYETGSGRYSFVSPDFR